MRRAVAVGLIAAGALCLVGSFGFYLNDEAEIGVMAYNLDHGRITADAVPPEYYRLDNGRTWDARVVIVNGHGYVTESKAGAFLALPAYGALALWTSLAPLQLAFATAAFGAFAGAAWLCWGARYRRAGGAWRLAIMIAATAIAAVWLIANARLVRPIDADPWLAPGIFRVDDRSYSRLFRLRDVYRAAGDALDFAPLFGMAGVDDGAVAGGHLLRAIPVHEESLVDHGCHGHVGPGTWLQPTERAGVAASRITGRTVGRSGRHPHHDRQRLPGNIAAGVRRGRCYAWDVFGLLGNGCDDRIRRPARVAQSKHKVRNHD